MRPTHAKMPAVDQRKKSQSQSQIANPVDPTRGGMEVTLPEGKGMAGTGDADVAARTSRSFVSNSTICAVFSSIGGFEWTLVALEVDLIARRAELVGDLAVLLTG